MPSHAHTLANDAFHSNLHEFCQRTSLHSWNLCFRPNLSAKHTVFWMSIIFASACSLGFMMFINIQEFSRATVSFNLESRTVPLDKVFLPSMVVCNMNVLRRSFLLSIMEDPSMSNVTERELRRLMVDQFIKGSSEESNTGNSAILKKIFDTNIYKNLSQEYVDNIVAMKNISNTQIFKRHILSEVVLEASPGEELEKVKRNVISEIASQFRDDDLITWLKFPGFGVSIAPGYMTDINEACIWLTPFLKEPGDVEDYMTMVPSAKNGANNGIELLLDAEVYDYALSYSGKEGFVVSVLHQLDQPIMRHSGMEIAPGFSVQMAVSSTLLDTTQSAKRRFTPVERQCYFEDEISLKHFPPIIGYRYEMTACLFEATVQKIETNCGCIPYFFAAVTTGYEACIGLQKKCMSKLIDNIGSERYILDDSVKKECLAACVDQTNKVQISQAAYPTNQAFPGSEDFCLVFRKLTKSCNGGRRLSLKDAYPELCSTIHKFESINDATCSQLYKVNVTVSGVNATEVDLIQLKDEVTNYARINMAKVVLYLKDPYVEKYLTEEKITETSFVGTIGGLMGLFMGFSFLSAIEVVYFIILHLNQGRKEEPVYPITVNGWKMDK